MTEIAYKRRKLTGIDPLKRPEARKLRARLTHVIHAFFVREAPKMAGQVITLRGKQPFVKADWSPEEEAALTSLVADLDFSGWSVLAGDVEDVIAEITKDGSLAALYKVGIDAVAKPEILGTVSRFATDYATERGAEMVGMKWVDGDLVPNPNAVWQITESTRDFIAAEVRKSLEEGVSNDILATRLQNGYAFSDSRAMMIARTETIKASNQGALAGYKASGVVEFKEWTTAEDDRVSEECEANGEEGAIPLDATFSSGDDAPPVHPNCRCVIVPVVTFASEQQPTPEEETA